MLSSSILIAAHIGNPYRRLTRAELIAVVNSITRYRFTNKDRLFIDASVLLRVFARNVAGRDAVHEYGNAYKKMITAKSKMFVDVLVISEYIGTHINYELRKPHFSKLTLKNFRKKKAYKETVHKIALTVRKIISICSPIESNFSGLCKSKGMKLITHDKDFINTGVTVITANKRMLKSKSRSGEK